MYEKIKLYSTRGVVALSAVVASASAACADTTGLIDFDAVVTAVQPMITSAVGKAVILGGLILAATLGWKFFKRFTK